MHYSTFLLEDLLITLHLRRKIIKKKIIKMKKMLKLYSIRKITQLEDLGAEAEMREISSQKTSLLIMKLLKN